VTEAEILDLSDLNLAEATREMTRWHPASVLMETGGVLLAAGPDAFPVGFGNAALRLDSRTAAADVIDIAGKFFSARGRGYTLWTGDHADRDLQQAAAAAGLQRLSESPGMVLDAPLPTASDPPGATLRWVDDEESARDFATVSARAYATLGLPEGVCAHLFEHPARIVAPHVISVVASVAGEARAAAMAILSHGIAGIYWVGTLESARGRGLGEACTRAVGNAAFERGARLLVLQASAQGEPIYRRMGYREVTRYVWYASFGSQA